MNIVLDFAWFSLRGLRLPLQAYYCVVQRWRLFALLAFPWVVLRCRLLPLLAFSWVVLRWRLLPLLAWSWVVLRWRLLPPLAPTRVVTRRRLRHLLSFSCNDLPGTCLRFLAFCRYVHPTLHIVIPPSSAVAANLAPLAMIERL